MPSSSDSENSEKEKVLLKLIRSRQIRLNYEGPTMIIAHELHGMDDKRLFEIFGIYRYQLLRLTAFIERKIREGHTRFQEMIRPRDRIIICLRFLATGCSFKDLGLHYDLSALTVQTIVLEVCDTILHELGPIVMPTPTKEDWEIVARKFNKLYDLPTCLGAFNVLQVNVMNTSILDFLAVVDSNCRFIMIDVGNYGMNKNMARALKKSKLGKGFRRNLYDLPPPQWIEGHPEPLPYVLVGGADFPTQPYLLTKYKPAACVGNDAFKVFNCRITPALRTAKEALNGLCDRFRIFKEPFPVPAVIVEDIMLTACCLHNYLRMPEMPAERDDHSYKVSQNRINVLRNAANRSDDKTKLTFHQYFLSAVGIVSWQWEPLAIHWM